MVSSAANLLFPRGPAVSGVEDQTGFARDPAFFFSDKPYAIERLDDPAILLWSTAYRHLLSDRWR